MFNHQHSVKSNVYPVHCTALYSMESHDCLKVNMCNLVATKVRIFDSFNILLDRIHILLGQIYKILGGGVIVLGAAYILVYALVIIFGQFSILFDQMHKTLVGAIVLDAFVITLSAVNIVIG